MHIRALQEEGPQGTGNSGCCGRKNRQMQNKWGKKPFHSILIFLIMYYINVLHIKKTKMKLMIKTYGQHVEMRLR